MRTRASRKNFLAVNAACTRVHLGPLLDYPPVGSDDLGGPDVLLLWCCAVPIPRPIAGGKSGASPSRNTSAPCSPPHSVEEWD